MIGYQEWMDGTKNPTKRTPELQRVDAALRAYNGNAIDANFEELTEALHMWARLKGLLPNGQIKTTRNPALVRRLQNDVFEVADRLYGYWLDQDMKLARKLCDPYLKKRVVGQGLGNAAEDQAKYKAGAGQSATALFGELQKFRPDENANIKPSAARAANVSSSPDFWYNKGQAAAGAPDKSGLWCDSSAALICYLLARNPSFKSRLDVVSQGDPKHYGHWYVVANRSDNDLLKFKYYFGADNGESNFTIDIWGALNAQLDSSVIYPGRSVYDCRHHTGEAYDHNRIAIQCTIPRKVV